MMNTSAFHGNQILCLAIASVLTPVRSMSSFVKTSRVTHLFLGGPWTYEKVATETPYVLPRRFHRL
jgi:hypothetical protein